VKFSYMVASNEIKGKNITGLIGDYDHLFNVIKDNGYQGIELLIKNPFLIDFKEIKKCLQKNNLDLPVLCTGEMFGEDGLSFGDADPNVRREAIKRTIETMKIAEEFNAHVNVGRLRGRFVDGVNTEDTINWAKEGFQVCAESNKNVNLLLEPINHNVSNFILTTEEGIKFVKELNKPNIKIMLDYIHMVLENEDLESSVRISKGYFDHVHVCDSDRKPLGMGEYNIEIFANLLFDAGYNGYVSIEAFDTNDYMSYIKKSIDVLNKAFRKCIIIN